MGVLLVDLMREFIGEALERLDRRLGGALTLLALACGGLACAMTSLAQDGNLRRLLPVTLVAALLVGAVVLIRWRLGVDAAPADLEAMPQDELNMDATEDAGQSPD